MPRHLSAWPDLVIQLSVLLVMTVIISQYNRYLAAIIFVVWLVLALFSRERQKDRVRKFQEYCENVIAGSEKLMHYAMKNIPQSVMVIDEEGRLEWFNELTRGFSLTEPQQGMLLDEFWKGILHEEVLESVRKDDSGILGEGTYIAKTVQKDVMEDGEPIEMVRYFRVRYKQMEINNPYPPLIVMFVMEITKHEKLKIEYERSRTVIMYIQVDNYDEIMRGLNEAEKTALMLSVSETLEKWMESLSGFIRRVSSELFVVVLEQYFLEKAIEEKFTVLDKVRQIISKNGIPVTLSIGISVADKRSYNQSMAALGDLAQEKLNAALARGGDQVAIDIDGKPQYFGGRAAAVEKHNRVRARVTANSLREYMENADEIFIMGHSREDFDSFGAAVGVAVMARHLKKPVHVVLSNYTESIGKITEQFRKDKTQFYENLFVKMDDLEVPTSLEPLLIVVDTHIPNLVAAPALLDRIPQVIVIDHHRKSDNVIKNPVLFYHEPSSSSASELVTELLMYFDDRVNIGKLAATALYSGIVVDTKSFVIQTGVRTFDAAAYLRRSGADPVVVRELFMSDYETAVALAKAKSHSSYYEGGLVVSAMPKIIPNIQAIAGQAADSLLTVENVRMTIVLFQMKDDVVGISARSGGNLNVQVIMEKFGGGGHQNVAGAQVRNTNIIELEQKVVEVAKAYIAEADKETEKLLAG